MATRDLICRTRSMAGLGLLTCLAATAPAESIVYPPDAGAVNVRDHGAKGDGVTDDTAAIQNALNAGVGSIVYLPNGTYLVSNRLAWPEAGRTRPLTLQGQSAAGAVIRLKDRCEGFADARRGRAVVWTQQMGSADSFRNHVRNLTIDTGRGNPGAVGLQFMSNNMGAVRDVTIRSGDGAGICGLDMAYNSLNGPLLVRQVAVLGFSVGVHCKGPVNSQTIDGLVLEGQRTVGLLNEGQVVSVRGVKSRNTVPAVRNTGTGVLTLLDSTLEGGAGAAAVLNDACLYARNLVVSGYAQAIANSAGTRQSAAGPKVDEFISHEVAALNPWSPRRALGLPIKDPPEVAWEQDFGQWANPRAFGAAGDGRTDDTAAIQKAIDSGKTTLYFPRGSYAVSGTIELRGRISRVVGMESTLTFGNQPQPVLKVVDGTGLPPAVVIEHLTFTPGNSASALDNASSRALIVLHSKAIGGAHTGNGEIFIEDCGSGVQRNLVLGRQRVWIRQLSNEPREGKTHLVNRGGDVWILGHKTEMWGTLAETTDGGRTEINGAFAYSGIGGDCDGQPMYIVKDAALSVTMGGTHYARRKAYVDIVQETFGGQTRVLKADQLPGRTGFRMLPLFTTRPQ